MFSGIIEEIGTVSALEKRGADAVLRIRAARVLEDMKPGDSIASSGVCLTARDITGDGFTADVSRETLDRTTLGNAGTGTRLNLERSIRLMDRLGGHLVQGHVDGAGRVVSREKVGDSELWWFEIPESLARYTVEKGSIALDGVSLTVAHCHGNRVSVAFIPTTLRETTFGAKGPGDPVNVECDIIGKYVEKLLGLASGGGAPSRITWEKLQQWGYSAAGTDALESQ